MRAHLGIFYADRGDLPLQVCSQAPRIKVAQPDWLTHLAIHSDERTKSQEPAH